MKTATTCSLTAISIALATAPGAAQQSVQDFTLPPNPTPTPTVEGPVDDSGLVPVAPRAIPTNAATPSPTPSPSPEQTNGPSIASEGDSATAPVTSASGMPVVQQVPRQASTPAVALPARPRPSSSGPAATIAPGEPAEDLRNVPETARPLPQFTQESAQASPPVRQDTMPPEDVPPWWLWAAGLIAALLAGLLGGWWLAKRRNNRSAPIIEPPIVSSDESDNAGPAAIGAEQLRITLEPEQLLRSVMMLTLNYRLVIANRSDRPVRDISISADLISARRAEPVERQLATASVQLPHNAKLDRIGPHQTATVTGQLQLQLSEIEVFQQGQLPLCVPLARFRIDGTGIEPQLRTFLVGLGSNAIGGKVHPLPLTGPPGSYEGVRARPLE